MGEYAQFGLFDPSSGARISTGASDGGGHSALFSGGEWNPGNVQSSDPHDEPFDTGDKPSVGPIPENIITRSLDFDDDFDGDFDGADDTDGDDGDSIDLDGLDGDDVAQDGDYDDSPDADIDDGDVPCNIVDGDDDDCDLDDDDFERGYNSGVQPVVRDMRGVIGAMGVVPGPFSRSKLR